MTIGEAMEIFTDEHDREVVRGGDERDATQAGIAAVLDARRAIDMMDLAVNS